MPESSSPLASVQDQVELPLLERPRFPTHFVNDSNSLEQLYKELKAFPGPIAIDAERASGFKYSQRAYLIQLRASSSDIYLIDPIAFCDTDSALINLSALLAEREWILHAATQDLPCLNELGLRPGAIFDTELGSRIAGESRVGLGSLTENLLGFKLAKEHSAADWSTRPLPESWLNYAALDVDVLHELKDAVSELLGNQEKDQWAQQEFENLLTFSPKPQKEERWRGLSGLHKVNDRYSLEIARKLWEARESLAQKLDVSPGRLIPDTSITFVAIAKPKSKSELATLKEFSGRASRSYLSIWWEAVSEAGKAKTLPSLKPESRDAIPNHRNWASKFPEADKRLRLAKAELQNLSEENNVPLENLLSPDFLRQLSFEPPSEIDIESISARLKDLGARPWQIGLTAGRISEAFTRAAFPERDPESTAPLESVERAEP